MRKPEKKETFTIQLKNKEKVKVKWTKAVFAMPGMHHLEFYGPMTNTGYRSHFVHWAGEEDPSLEEVSQFASDLAQKWWEENTEKYGRQTELFPREEVEEEAE